MYSRFGEFSYLLEDGYAIITGYDKLSDEVIEIPAEINGHRVRVLGEDAFYHCGVKRVVIPEGVEEIRSGAFSECSYLKKVILPSTLKKICKGAFYECDNLEFLKVIASCYVESNAVVGYSFKNIIYVGEGSRNYEIDGVIFDRETDYLILYPSEKLGNEYIIPDFVKGVASGAFNKIETLKKVTIPNSMTSISFGAFEGFVGLEDVVLHDNVEWIENHAFCGCSSLKHISLPDNIKGIQTGAFALSGLERIKLPTGITHLPKEVFLGCNNLCAVENTEQILHIGRYAFKGCCSLKEITLGNGIVVIDTEAFAHCTSLSRINMPEYSKKPAFEDTYLDKSEYDMLRDSLIAIQSYSFLCCESLKSFFIPRNTRFISGNAFDRCKKLKKLFIPLSVEEIQGDELGYPSYLTDIYYEGTEEDWYRIKKSQKMKEKMFNSMLHYNCATLANN